MGFFDKLLGSQVSEAVTSVGQVIDNITTTDEEKLKAKTEITKVVADLSTGIAEAQKEVLVTEMKGNWLQKSWRPVIMLAFGFVIIYEYFIAPVTGAPRAGLPGNFWDLMELGMGGYVIGRSAEKIVDSFSGKVQINTGKK